jgi:hypothetical protein
MSIGGGEGITLHKITKCADIIRKKNCHMDPDSPKMLDLNSYPDPNSMIPDP